MKNGEYFPLNKELVGDNEKAAEEGRDITGNHFSNLYDLQEDMAGQKVDEATGEQIDNSGPKDEDMLEVQAVEHGTTDALPDLKEEDAAEKWLRENDPNYGKK